MDLLMCFCAMHILLYCILAPFLIFHFIRICFRSITRKQISSTGRGSEQEQEHEQKMEIVMKSEKILSLSGNQFVSRRIDVPNHLVGVLIGKGGGTLRILHKCSNAKILITSDWNADPLSDTRPVHLIGPLSKVNKAEKIINQLMAGLWSPKSHGVPIAAATLPSNAAEKIQIQTQIPYTMAGYIIGKNGRRIHDVEKRSGARVKFLPTNLGGGAEPTEKTLVCSGDAKQVQIAMELVKEIMEEHVMDSSLLWHICLHGSPPVLSYVHQQCRGGPNPPPPGGNICVGSCWFAAGCCRQQQH